MKNNQVLLHNNLTASIDWLSFTVHELPTPDSVIEFMGFDSTLFQEMPNGANGYKSMRKYENISVLYDGRENMGIHVNVTGSSVGIVLDSFESVCSSDVPFGSDTVLSRFLSELLEIGKVTRIDLAIDDLGGKYFSLTDIEHMIDNHQVVSKWRSSRHLKECTINDNEKIGHTIYFGSSQSEVLLRIYDKQLERNKGLSANNERYCSDKWVRWELQLKGDRAIATSQHLASGLLIGQVAIGILSNYFRIIELDDSNRSRCSLNPLWEEFVDSVEKLKITLEKKEKSLDEQQEYFERQYGRTVALLYAKELGDSDYFPNLADRYKHKLTITDYQRLDSYFRNLEVCA